MKYTELDIARFTGLLASKAAVPGGGGASALAGALGSALCGMVCNLTIGKKKYEDYDDENKVILNAALSFSERLLALIDEDAKLFEPLSKAYAIPKERADRDEIMEICLRDAASVPIEILRLSCDVLKLFERLLGQCSMLAVSDVGTGAAFCRSAMLGAAMNVRINTAGMKDSAYAHRLDLEVEKLLEEYIPIADLVYNKVWEML